VFMNISDLELSGPTVDRTMKLCTSCGEIHVKEVCASCSNSESIVFLDRRPLLLSTELNNAIRNKINHIGDHIGEMEEDEREFNIQEFVPFLSTLLDESTLAGRRKQNSSKGYRETGLSTIESLELIDSMRIPTTLVEKA